MVCENYKFVLIDKCPIEPPLNASRSIWDVYDRWISANEKARCFLLAGMSDVLRSKHKTMDTAYEI